MKTSLKYQITEYQSQLEDFDLKQIEFIQTYEYSIVSNKALKYLEFLTSEQLLSIHPNKLISKELCIYFLSFITETLFNSDFKLLNAEKLRELLSPCKKDTYKKIIDVLLEGTEKGPIIECNNSYKIGVKSKGYRLTSMGADFRKYYYKTDFVKEIKQRNYLKMIAEYASTNNIIVNNILKTYSKTKLPTISLLKLKANRLLKENYTKKGKVYTKESFKLHIKMFEYYCLNGYIWPVIAGENGGGRVFDSYNMLPEWIREEFTMDGEKEIQLDAECFFPNLVVNHYKGNNRYISHQEVADYLGIEKAEAKIEHLSFFNKKEFMMRKSPLWDFYSNTEGTMLWNVLQDKRENGYKITSKVIFKKEVDTINEIIKLLNMSGIYVRYVFDCLVCKESEVKIVKGLMENIFMKNKIYSRIK